MSIRSLYRLGVLVALAAIALASFAFAATAGAHTVAGSAFGLLWSGCCPS